MPKPDAARRNYMRSLKVQGEWLDAYGGHAVSSTGHSHPDVVRAICEQAGRLLEDWFGVTLPFTPAAILATETGEDAPVTISGRPDVVEHVHETARRARVAARELALPTIVGAAIGELVPSALDAGVQDDCAFHQA